MEFDIGVFYKICREKFKFHYNLTRIAGTLHEDHIYIYIYIYIYTFFIISRSFLFRKRNDSPTSCKEKQNTFMFIIFFFENGTVCDVIWKNIVEPDNPHDLMRMRIHTQSERVVEPS